jgi:hypothetical protein
MAEPRSEPRLRRGPGVTSAEVHGEAVLLDLKRGKYYALNPTGAAVWELLAEPRSREELQTAMLARYDVAPEVLRADLAALLEDLRDNGLVEDDRA